MIFYTYLWLHEDGTPYYVGKGTGGRAFRKGCPKDRSRIQVVECPSEDVALEYEKLLIAAFGRKDQGEYGKLRNLTDGGDGWTGAKHSLEARGRIATAMFGNQRGKANKGKKRSEEVRRHNGDRKRGLPSPNREKKLGPLTPEQRQKQSTALRNSPKLAVHLNRLHEKTKGFRLGIKHTEETRQKMRGPRKRRDNGNN